MTQAQDVAKAKAIAVKYPWSVHGLEYDITADPENVGAVRLVFYEENFNEFSDTNRMILTEQIIDLATTINEVVPCGIIKSDYLRRI